MALTLSATLCLGLNWRVQANALIVTVTAWLPRPDCERQTRPAAAIPRLQYQACAVEMIFQNSCKNSRLIGTPKAARGLYEESRGHLVSEGIAFTASHGRR